MEPVIDPDLRQYEWKDVDEYAHVRRRGIITDTEHQAVNATREEAAAEAARVQAATPPEPEHDQEPGKLRALFRRRS
ncbi:hypothetical protein ACLGI4_00140 [Streptomyces sp. HMX112]|uniref:hypothetical protein n=1 Tax=Streptomyces sp. HMX112 TaxID=3390850 RepID=UPI003A7F9113